MVVADLKQRVEKGETPEALTMAQARVVTYDLVGACSYEVMNRYHSQYWNAPAEESSTMKAFEQVRLRSR